MRDRWRPWTAIGITAFAFGLLHLNLVHSVLALFVGVLLGWVTELTSSIRPAITAHMVNNTVAMAAVAVFPGPWSSASHAWLLGFSLLIALTSIVVLSLRTRSTLEPRGSVE